MKTKITLALIATWLAIGIAVAGGFHGSHPDFGNNGIHSPRFVNGYGSPTHPQHP